MGGVIEHVGRGRVDRDGAGIGRRVRLLAGMEGSGLGSEGRGIEFGHVVGSPWCLVGDGSRWSVAAPGARSWAGRVSADTRRVVRRTNKKPRLLHGVRGPGTLVSVVLAPTSCQVRVTSDPILRTAGPPAHTHVPGAEDRVHRSMMVGEDGMLVNHGPSVATWGDRRARQPSWSHLTSSWPATLRP
jgi:hypothetical protein